MSISKSQVAVLCYPPTWWCVVRILLLSAKEIVKATQTQTRNAPTVVLARGTTRSLALPQEETTTFIVITWTRDTRNLLTNKNNSKNNTCRNYIIRMAEHNQEETKRWIRGVNIGGWLLAERFITPYLFAVNTCQLAGDLCWYPGQALDEQEVGQTYLKYNTSNICDPNRCHPVRPLRAMDGNSDYHPLNAQPYQDYPMDEWTLGQIFSNRTLARLYMERHWDTFVTYEDLRALKEAGVTHMRVPLSFWMRGDVRPGEPWIPGAWPYFVRFAKWVQEIGGMEIWADLHGAPGSENGFDNSGQYLGGSTGGSTCLGWTKSAAHVERTVDILTDFATAMANEGLQTVITGFGLLNEPFFDCDTHVLRNYYDQGLHIVRTILGPETSVFVGDMFRAKRFNDGFWTDQEEHYKTYLDSHPYHVFFEQGRSFTPRQHIAYVCRNTKQDVESCCYQDAPVNTVPAAGINRIVGEWSAAYDQLPTALTPHIMKVIAARGSAPLLNRTLSPERMAFLRNFVQAQMVTYETRDSGISSGWLFWNFKMEGGAFAEWDFLRGIREGWIPQLPDPTIASEDLFGSCLSIYNRTDDNYTIVEEYPDPRTLDWKQYQGWDVTDDFVLSDPNIPNFRWREQHDPTWLFFHLIFPALIVLSGLLFTFRKYLVCKRRDRVGYEELK